MDEGTPTDLPRRHVLIPYGNPRPFQQRLQVGIAQYLEAHVMVEAVDHNDLVRRPAELVLARLAEFLLEAGSEPAWTEVLDH